MNKSDYLKRYLSNSESNHSDTSKKKKIKNTTTTSNLKIIDTDYNYYNDIKKKDSDNEEEIPKIMSIEERLKKQNLDNDENYLLERKHKELKRTYTDGAGWGEVNISNKISNKGVIYSNNHDDPSSLRRSRRPEAPEHSPPRRTHNDSDKDKSPPMRKRDSGISIPRRRNISPDISPPRRKRNDSPDNSPPRRKRNDSPDNSPPRRKKNDSPDNSPPRRKKNDSPDNSPPRRNRNDSTNNSPPRRKRNDSPDNSPPRRSNKRLDSPDQSPPRRNASPPRKPRHDSASPPRTRTDEVSSRKTLKELSGEGSATIIRDKTGRKLTTAEIEEQINKLNKGKEEDEPMIWGQGLQQAAEREASLAKMAEQVNQPMARTKIDSQLDKKIREVKRFGDPMNKIKRMDAIDNVDAEIPEKSSSNSKKKSIKVSEFYPPIPRPFYRGAPFANRFGIAPGYRWDGQDRSNAWEKQWFLNQNKREAKAADNYVHNVESM